MFLCIKKVKYLILFLLVLPLAWADICTDTVEIRSNCTMITPTLNCSVYNYSIFNESGSQVETGSLHQLDSNIYKFNFTLEEGAYVVKLCDGSTREVRVAEDDKMLIAVIALLPLILGFFFIIGAATMGEEHKSLRIFLFLLSIMTFFVSMHFGMIGLVRFYDFPELQETIGSTVYWIAWIVVVIITYFLIYLFYKIVQAAAQKKDSKLEY